MDNTKINAEFVEKFGELEKLCGDIYSQKHGVSCYIDDMASKNGERYVFNWDYYKKRLKDIRHKRNKLTHGEIAFSENFANKEDIKFITEFISLIFKSQDPISIYNKKVNKHKMQNTVKASENKKTSISDVLLITGLIILVIIIACLIFNNQ
ncbi:MAG: hypothetical protein E7365_06615 [Clostridiales bacterium]|nr:hypothetical protein [Clostridiales bacterium]